KGDIAKVHAPLFEMQIEGGAEAKPDTKPDTVAASATKPVTASVSASEDFILPDIGEGIVECEIVDWLVSEGDDIVEDQPVCDVMTDKALVQIPAKYSGKVTKLYYAKGDIAKVHSPLFAMTHAGAVAVAEPAQANPASAPVASCAVKAEMQQVAAGIKIGRASCRE